MSRTSMAVLFPDGEIRYGLINGTAGTICPRLFSTGEARELADISFEAALAITAGQIKNVDFFDFTAPKDH